MIGDLTQKLYVHHSESYFEDIVKQWQERQRLFKTPLNHQLRNIQSISGIDRRSSRRGKDECSDK
eukprot:scaffold10301_cov115-Skeletonema_dohrnii-CCMP3373.AAC.2